MKKALRIIEAAVTFVSGPVQGLAILILMGLVLTLAILTNRTAEYRTRNFEF